MKDPIDIQGIGRLHFVDGYEGDTYKILILDDDEEVLSSVRDFLLLRGIDRVDIATTPTEASEKISNTKYDAILADVLLYDPSQDHSSPIIRGDQWLLQQRENLDYAFKAAVTGFPDRIEDPEALRGGGIEIIRKGDEAESALYENLVRRANEKKVRLEERLTSMAQLIRSAVLEDINEGKDHAGVKDHSAPSEHLATCLMSLSSADTVHIKGKKLEEMAEAVFSLIPGLRIVGRDKRLAGEEFDLILENNIPGTFWTSLHSPFFLVECKNETQKTGSPEVAKFLAKLLKHKNLSNFGFMLSASGFTKGALTELLRYGATEFSVALIGPEDLQALIRDTSRVEEWLKGAILRSLLR